MVTVQQLIDELRKLPPELPVVVETKDHEDLQDPHPDVVHNVDYEFSSKPLPTAVLL